jgi:hypothetical protein
MVTKEVRSEKDLQRDKYLKKTILNKEVESEKIV